MAGSFLGFGRRNDARRDDADHFLVAAVIFELHHAVDHRIDREIAAEANICAWAHQDAALAHDNAARTDDFAAVAFHATHLRLAIATVARAADAFFMCHWKAPFTTRAAASVVLAFVVVGKHDVVDRDLGVALAVAGAAAIAGF